LFGVPAYSYQVSAVDNVNNESALSQAVPFTTPGCPDTTPPFTPSNLTVAAFYATNFTFSWTASTDQSAANQLVSGVTGYFVYRDESLLQFVTSTSFTDGIGLRVPCIRYRVSAVDAASNVSSQSGPLEVTSLPAVQVLPRT
jgi:hypothetical protein